MGSFVRAAAASALLFTAVAPNPAFALVPAPIVPVPMVPAPIAPAPQPVPHVVGGSSSAGAGAAVTGGFSWFCRAVGFV